MATDNTTWGDASHLSCRSPWETWTSAAGADENKPIVCESWYEAYAFCIWDGGFLPSEAEWNYAAAGGSDQRAYPWSSAYPPGSTTIDCTYANYYIAWGPCVSPPNGGTNNVGSESPKGNGKWGQADLTGNVWERSLDYWDGISNYATPCTDCANLTVASNRVFRGGAFDNEDLRNLTASVRADNLPAVRDYRVGVRCARTP